MSTPKVPRYVARIARLPEVFAKLAEAPGGLPLRDLAEQVGASEADLREDLLAFFTADPGWTLQLSRPAVLEFCSPDGEDDDPARAEVVRIVEPADLGVEHLDAEALALIYTAATTLLEVEPGNADLVAAVGVIEETMFGIAENSENSENSGGTAGPGESGRDAPSAWARWTEPLRGAIEARRRVRIVYSPAWKPGVRERVIEPLRLVQTRRGWEVDAAVVGADGSLRTYLLDNVRRLEVLAETFEPPAGAAAGLAALRATTRVRMELPHETRWAADMYAESVVPLEESDGAFVADLYLLEPVERRVGLLMLAAGGEVRVLEPASLVSAGPAVAAQLLAHHEALEKTGLEE